MRLNSASLHTSDSENIKKLKHIVKYVNIFIKIFLCTDTVHISLFHTRTSEKAYIR